MEIRVLQYFLTVAREQSISAAAEYLHLTQPTLSRQLKDLEKELGKTLMIRGGRNRGIILTEDGMLLRKRAEEIIELVSKTEKEVMLSEPSVCGDIYIGTAETDAIRLLAQTARQIQAVWPGIHFHMVSGDSVDILERIDKGLLDFGILMGDAGKKKYDYLDFPLLDTWGVLMRKDCELAQKETIVPEDLWDKPLILSRQSLAAGELAHWFQKDSTELNIVATYSLIFNASLMVDEGMGYALGLDRLINTTGDSSLCFRPLFPKYTLGMDIRWKKYRILSKAAEVFISELQQSLTQAPKMPLINRSAR